MRLYTTKVRAISPTTGKLTNYCGQYVPGISFEDAERYCELNGLGYLEVTGLLISEIPLKDGKADFSNEINYENLN